jgi:UDP-N-acetylmuramyl pentapeptide phosphotransferase/UDP-N-acetylglucosamine-1-phosphate transferase
VRALLSGAVAGAVAATALRALRGRAPGGAPVWERTNHAGRTVTLLEGPAYAVGSATGAALLGAGPGPVVATVASAGFGALDDLRGDSSSKGLKGHLGALAHGRVTTGAVKILGLGVTGLAAALMVDRRLRDATDATEAQAPTALDTLVGGAVVAGSANLLNLLDLRPGRALKVALALAAALATDRRSAASAGAAAGAAAGLLGPDLAGEAMLGDTGANAAGALVGTALLQRSGRRGRLVALAALVGLTLASERVSFTTVIESTPGLRELDALGRR